eukprot:TRINITY_DN18822_c0_g1_i1.p1 TRINITY_DN18822_c0_g1~~TRINITY_DN18822_c0_g1_i1.p1  ORF type:complete len:363 (+),score=68.19 TRINITY_DN18822_c0_g1_i1:119-1090(+)
MEDAACCDFTIDRREQTQVLYNDWLELVAEYIGDAKGSWGFVRNSRQPNYSNNSWVPYEGYMRSSQYVKVDAAPVYHLAVTARSSNLYGKRCDSHGCLPSDVVVAVSMGTWLTRTCHENGWWCVNTATGGTAYVSEADVAYIRDLPEEEARTTIVQRSLDFLGTGFYLWGGRSTFTPSLWGSQLTGVDCSGLVGLLYQSIGLLLPRDANPQFLLSRNVTGGAANMKPGDLFFFAPTTSTTHKKNHVLLLFDNEYVVEASGSEPVVNVTRKISIKSAFGVTLDQLQWGQTLPARTNFTIYWGRYLPWNTECVGPSLPYYFPPCN